MSNATVTLNPTPGNRSLLPRRLLYRKLAGIIWAWYCHENDLIPTRFEDAPPMFRDALLGMVESMANMALEPDRKDAALMAMAERILACESGGQLTFNDVARKRVASCLVTAENALDAYLLNLRDQPPSVTQRDEMMRWIDAIAPKRGVS